MTSSVRHQVFKDPAVIQASQHANRAMYLVLRNLSSLPPRGSFIAILCTLSSYFLVTKDQRQTIIVGPVDSRFLPSEGGNSKVLLTMRLRKFAPFVWQARRFRALPAPRRAAAPHRVVPQHIHTDSRLATRHRPPGPKSKSGVWGGGEHFAVCIHHPVKPKRGFRLRSPQQQSPLDEEKRDPGGLLLRAVKGKDHDTFVLTGIGAVL